MNRISPILSALAFLYFASLVHADELTVNMNLVNDKGIGQAIGTIRIVDEKYGLLLIPALGDLPPGPHGFHVHENGDCGPKDQNGKMIPALAAGGHFDPAKSGKHEGPYADGHLGDLPALWVGADGKATTPILDPRLKVSDLKGHSLMIHAGGDNYSDKPAPLGGGGARMACGVVK
jgi:superoxide dismutase, Cu-Zn family